jgi:O-antigen/teichoic acid export membrane protein
MKLLMAGTTEAAPRHRAARFVINTFWTWLGVGVMLFTGFLLSPYLVRKLGPEGYGIWVLSFSLVDYYAFLDLGFRSATVKYVAHYWTLGDHDNVNAILNTGILYAGLISAPLFALIVLASNNFHKFFHISPELLPSFRLLMILISLSWCLGFVFNTFNAALEAVQRFDLSNKVNVVTTVIRSGGTAVLLSLGFGLISIGVLVVISQGIGYTLNVVSFRRIFPQLKVSRRYASLKTLKEMGKFGIHTFVLNMSYLLLNQSPPLVIGHFLPAAFIGFYSLPNRLIQYTGGAVSGIGAVVNANAAELQARGEKLALSRLAIFTNRYCLTLFMPLAIVFSLFSKQLFQLWVPPAVQYAAPLLPVLTIGYLIAVAGQYSSGMLLLGLGRHQWFARGQLLEGFVCIGALIYATPRAGILGAAYVVAGCMIVNRGLFAPWLLSRELDIRFSTFMLSIYARPTLIALPVAALAMWLRMTILPGATWMQLFSVSGLVAMVYFIPAYFICLADYHRSLVQKWARIRLTTLVADP